MSGENQILFNESIDSTWAEIILPLALPNVYTYTIPANLIDKAKLGCRVEVVFGKNKKYAGVIKSVITAKPAYQTKPILNILDDTPLVYPQQLQLWAWVSEYYMCTEGEVMTAALPANFKLNSETILIYNEDTDYDFSGLDDEEYLVAEALQIRKQLQLSEIQQLLDVSHVYPVIKRLIEKNICFIWEQLNEKYKAKKETYVELHSDYNNEEKLAELLNDWKGAPKQMELLLGFIHLQRSEGEVSKAALLKKTNAAPAQFNALCEKKVLIAIKRNVDRIKSSTKKTSGGR